VRRGRVVLKTVTGVPSGGQGVGLLCGWVWGAGREGVLRGGRGRGGVGGGGGAREMLMKGEGQWGRGVTKNKGSAMLQKGMNHELVVPVRLEGGGASKYRKQ